MQNLCAPDWNGKGRKGLCLPMKVIGPREVGRPRFLRAARAVRTMWVLSFCKFHAPTDASCWFHSEVPSMLSRSPKCSMVVRRCRSRCSRSVSLDSNSSLDQGNLLHTKLFYCIGGEDGKGLDAIQAGQAWQHMWCPSLAGESSTTTTNRYGISGS